MPVGKILVLALLWMPFISHADCFKGRQLVAADVQGISDPTARLYLYVASVD